jgi:hypothetical protein
MADKAKLQALFRAKAEARESGARPAPSVAELRAARAAKAPDAAPRAAPASLPAPAPRLPVAAPAAAAPAPPPRPMPAPSAPAAAARERPAAARDDEQPAKRANVGGALPAGFFDDKAADAKARGVALPTQDAAYVAPRLRVRSGAWLTSSDSLAGLRCASSKPRYLPT